MYKFPKDLYTDVRIETVFETNITLENFELKQNKVKKDTGAMIRIFDGSRWYYSVTSRVETLQEEIDSLAKMAAANPKIYSHPVVEKMEVNQDACLQFKANDVSLVDNTRKYEVLKSYIPVIKEFEQIQISKLYYLDKHTEKHVISSKGTDVTFDTQFCCVAARYMLQCGGNPCRGSVNVYHMNFDDLEGKQEKLRNTILKDIEYYENAVPVVPGVYTCVLSPETTGVFAHESFGHKSESDFMVGDETMKREWALGKQVGSSILSIIDTGLEEGSGYVPYDDEGCKAKKNYIIKDGILTGRLHSAATAACLEEESTGNARAINFEFEPIVRMTTTYIDKGTLTKDELIAVVPNGIYIESIFHGSGMTTFTIAPQRAYMIRDGKIAEPVKIAVISGNVMKTLGEIDGVSDQVELHAFALGGCGKMEQFPLPVGFGGPYIRVNGINVQ
ncbi:MAG: TldD/PmbA family protein [Mobilitalea sp.]